MTKPTYSELRREAEAYYALCERAEALGILTDLDGRDFPQTVAELQEAVDTAAITLLVAARAS